MVSFKILYDFYSVLDTRIISISKAIAILINNIKKQNQTKQIKKNDQLTKTKTKI